MMAELANRPIQMQPKRLLLTLFELAEEYRIYFGQASLDEYVRIRFPDKSWLPGPLHRKLLELPWADVLTTNWDTLLERAADFSRSRCGTIPCVPSPIWRTPQLPGSSSYMERLVSLSISRWRKKITGNIRYASRAL